MGSIYTVKSGDCAWKYAEMSLKKREKRTVTNQDIMKEMQRLADEYNCESIDTFNQRFAKVGNTFEEKAIPTENKAEKKAEEKKVQKEDTSKKKPTEHNNTTPISHQQRVKKDWKIIQYEQAKINNLSSNEQKVIEWNKLFNKDNKENYVVINKKECKATVYSPDGKIVKEYEVGLAKDKGDALLSRGQGNDIKATSAGIYTANYRATGYDDYSKLYNDRILTLSNDSLKLKGVGNGETGVALHQVPIGNEERIGLLNQPGVSEANNRFSDGCVNFLAEDFDDCMSQIKGVGTKVYILPEEDNNYICVKNGKLHFTQKQYTGNVATTSTKKDPYYMLNITAKTDIGDKGQDLISGLENNKKNLMSDLGIDNDTYNELAEVCLGIAGQETKYGSPTAGLSNLCPYWLKENAPNFVGFIKSLRGNHSYNSRGITQMKLKGYTDKDVINLLNKYSITEDDLDNGKKCAIATMIVLGSIYKNELPALKTQMTKNNISKKDAILYCWSNQKYKIKNGTATPNTNLYVQNVHRFMDKFQIEQFV